MKAEDIDSEVVGCDPFAMERIDAADLAEIVLGCLGMELVLRQRFLPGQETKARLMDLDHECILHAADRTVTHREFGKVGVDLETHRSAVATSGVCLKRTCSHGGGLLCSLTPELTGAHAAGGAIG